MKLILRQESRLQNAIEIFVALLFGGVGYYGLEILFRGHSHPSMALCGAVCFFFIDRLNAAYPRLLLPLKALFSCFFITAVELLAGCILNLWCGLEIWNYNELPLNFWGQICLPFCVVWFLLCFPVCLLNRLMRYALFYDYGRG